MLFISIALHSEASIFIKEFKLKKENRRGKFAFYTNENIKLVVTGIGKLNSAIGTTCLLAGENLGNEDLILNIGICGSTNMQFPIGEIFLIHKITDYSTSRDYYPDNMKSIFSEARITTFDLPVFKKSFIENDTLIDMESSGFFEAASFFFSPDKIHIIKIISDHLNPETITKELILELFQNKSNSISSYILEVQKKNLTISDIPTELIDIHDKFIEILKLTNYQSILLKKKMLSFFIREKKLPTFMNEFLFQKNKSKVDSKSTLKEIFTKLDKI